MQALIGTSVLRDLSTCSDAASVLDLAADAASDDDAEGRPASNPDGRDMLAACSWATQKADHHP